MKNLHALFVSLVLAACCQNSEAWFQGGEARILAAYPKPGTQCEYKAQVTVQFMQDMRSGNAEMYQNLDTYYNFGKVTAEEVAVLTKVAYKFERYGGTPSQAYKEVVAACKAGKF